MYALEDLPVKKIPRWSKICIEVVYGCIFSAYCTDTGNRDRYVGLHTKCEGEF